MQRPLTHVIQARRAKAGTEGTRQSGYHSVIVLEASASIYWELQSELKSAVNSISARLKSLHAARSLPSVMDLRFLAASFFQSQPALLLLPLVSRERAET